MKSYSPGCALGFVGLLLMLAPFVIINRDAPAALPRGPAALIPGFVLCLLAAAYLFLRALENSAGDNRRQGTEGK